MMTTDLGDARSSLAICLLISCRFAIAVIWRDLGHR